ncbi:MAG TPA: class I SAM-dependent methyltransferase [Myxococcota bacterium]|nr:class I SAM-dependent methyltransferase [Myxococcota bacterium]
MIDKPDRDNFEQWNAEMARKYDPDAYHHHPSPLVRFVERRRVRTILKFLTPTEGTEVLEVGCGAGNVLEQIRGARLFGVDICDEMLGKARDRLGARATLVKSDAAALPFSDGRFCRVYCTEVLEHVLDPRAVMVEIRRVLAPDGIAVVSVPNEAMINRFKDIALGNPVGRRLLREGSNGYHASPRMDDEWHLHAFDANMLRQVCSGIFDIQEIAAIPFPGLPARFVARLTPR